jgi:hypothetical protein
MTVAGTATAGAYGSSPELPLFVVAVILGYSQLPLSCIILRRILDVVLENPVSPSRRAGHLSPSPERIHHQLYDDRRFMLFFRVLESFPARPVTAHGGQALTIKAVLRDIPEVSGEHKGCNFRRVKSVTDYRRFIGSNRPGMSHFFTLFA